MTETNLALTLIPPAPTPSPDPSAVPAIAIASSALGSCRIETSTSFTERERALNIIDSRIALYCDQLSNHPARALLTAGTVPLKVLYECAVTQFKSSVLWVPLLSLLKDRAHNARLKQALLDNLLCESGARGVSHVELCANFVDSVRRQYEKLHGPPDQTSLLDVNLSELLLVAALSEPSLTGWLLAAEALTPATDQILLEGFQRLDNIDCQFLKEHISVDSEEHAVWMREAACELLLQSPCLTEIVAGIDLGARAEFKLLDLVYTKTLV